MCIVVHLEARKESESSAHCASLPTPDKLPGRNGVAGIAHLAMLWRMLYTSVPRQSSRRRGCGRAIGAGITICSFLACELRTAEIPRGKWQRPLSHDVVSTARGKERGVEVGLHCVFQLQGFCMVLGQEL